MKKIDKAIKRMSSVIKTLHKTGRKNCSNNYTFIYAPGAQHVGPIDTQIVIGEKAFDSDDEQETELPDCLATKEAMLLWQSAMDKGWVDENYQPKLSRTLSALLAYEMAERLKIKDKWKTFEKLWHRNNMHSDYNTALSQHQSLKFNEKLKTL